MRRWSVNVLAWSVASISIAAQTPASTDVREWMARVGERVKSFYARAQSIICEETVRVELLGTDLLPDRMQHATEWVYELRITWDAEGSGREGTAEVLRQLLKVNGRAPRARDEPRCFDEKPVNAEPLTMLLPHRQPEYVFTWKGPTRERNRGAVAIDFKSVPTRDPVEAIEKPGFEGKDPCWEVELPGRRMGRIWLDASTGDVLRLEESLTGQVDVRLPQKSRGRRNLTTATFERLDTSITYREVTFHDPEEKLILPASIVTLQVVRGESLEPRLRAYHSFSKYRRFITDARIVQ